MKRLMLVLTNLIIAINIVAQTPEMFSYMAIIRDSQGEVVSNQQVSLLFSIIKNDPKGIVVYQEEFTPTTKANGSVNLNIGTGYAFIGDFSDIQWGENQYFLKTEVDSRGGTNYEELSITQFNSVPYALNAKTAENVFSGNYNDLANQPDLTGVQEGRTAYLWGNHANAGYLTSFEESDTIFKQSAAGGITEADKVNWAAAYSWGNHAEMGYLTSYTETDSVFKLSPAYTITNEDLLNIDNLISWGNHSDAGYLTSFEETDTIFKQSAAGSITEYDKINWTNAYNWGNHSEVGYLTNYTEKDSIFTSSPAFLITDEYLANIDSLISWGNHAEAGYLTSALGSDSAFLLSPASGIGLNDIARWDSAYSWGNHAEENYVKKGNEKDHHFMSSPAYLLTNDHIGFIDSLKSWGNHAIMNYLTSYEETDSVFLKSVASSISELDTALWNSKVSVEMDGDTTNEIQTISRDRLTVSLSHGGGSFKDSVNVYTAGEGIIIENNVISLDTEVTMSIASDSTVAEKKVRYVGELYGGGIVFYVSPDGKSGLIVSKDVVDGGNGAEWSNVQGQKIGKEAQHLFEGMENSLAIVSQPGHTISAAQLCLDYESDGYDDWYLPSIMELKELGDAIYDVYDALKKNGITDPWDAFGSGSGLRLWSSTEYYGANEARYYHTIDDRTSETTKDSKYRVRAIRKFSSK